MDARGAGIVRRVPEGRRRRAGTLLRAGAVSRRGGRRRVLQRKRRRPGGRRAIFGWVLAVPALRTARPRGAPRAGPAPPRDDVRDPGRTRDARRRPGAVGARRGVGCASRRQLCARVGAFFSPRGDGAGGGRAAVRAGRRARAQAQAGDRRRGRWTLGRRRSSDATRASRRNRGGVRPGQSGWFAAGCVFPLGAG